MTLPTPQLPLDMPQPPPRRLHDYVDAPAGAVEMLEAAADHAGADWVYLHGVDGTGKSHLLLGVVSRAHECGRIAAYLPLQKARGRLGEALQALEQHAVVALDDIPSIAGQAGDERALFDFHNRMRDAGRTVLYAGVAAPDRSGLQLPDLVSRLGQCTRIRLEPLDDAGRAELLRRHADRRGLLLDVAAVDWLLQHVPRDAVSLLAAFDRLDRASLAAQRRITLPFLRQVLASKD